MFMLRSTMIKYVSEVREYYNRQIIELRAEVEKLNTELAKKPLAISASIELSKDPHADTRAYFHRMGLDVTEFCATHWGIGNARVVAADYWPTKDKWRLRKWKSKAKTLHSAAFLVLMLSDDDNWQTPRRH